MSTIRNMIIVSALALATSAPAYATFGSGWFGSSFNSGGYKSGPCGSPGCAPCTGGSSSSTSSTGGSSSYGGSTSTGGTTTSGGSTSTGGSTSGGSSGNSVPEPADFALFAIGVGGLLLGRRSTRKVRKDAE